MRMNGLERILASRIKSVSDSAFLKNWAEADVSVSSDPYKKSAIAYICISTTQRAISQVPLIIQEKQGEEWIRVSDSNPWQMLFNHPHPAMTQQQFIEALVGYLMLDGNVWTLPFPPGTNGVPDSLWVINKKQMNKGLNEANTHMVEWVYSPRQGMEIPIALDEVAHAKFWNPVDPYIGQAPLDAGKLPLDSDYLASEFNKTFFSEGAVVSGVLSTEKNLGDKQFERARQQFEAHHKGHKKAHRFALLEGGLKYEPMTITQRDMDFVELRKFSRQEILQCFGMKEAILSITEDVNYSTFAEERREWWQDTNLPMMRMITGALNWVLFRETNTRVAFDVSNIAALQLEMGKKTDMANKLWTMGVPFNDINQLLELNLPSYPWHDKGYIQMAFIPIDEAGDYLDPEPTPSDDSTEEDEDEKIIPTINRSTEREDLIFRNINIRLAPLESRLKQRIKKVLFEMRSKALALNEEKIFNSYTKDLSDILADSFTEEKDKMEKITRPIIGQALMAGVASMEEEISQAISFNLDDPMAVAFLSEKPVLIRGIVDTIQNQIVETLQEGLGQGESIAQLSDRIRTVFNVSKSRATTIARTEIIGASNYGRHYALRSSGARWKKWVTAGDEKVRPATNPKADHMSMNGKIQAIDEPWIVPFDNATLAYPGDYTAPAHQVINCRCIEVMSEFAPGEEL